MEKKNYRNLLSKEDRQKIMIGFLAITKHIFGMFNLVFIFQRELFFKKAQLWIFLNFAFDSCLLYN